MFKIKEINRFVRTSPLDRIPTVDSHTIYDIPLVGITYGDDLLFTELKTVVDPSHLTPHECLAKASNKYEEGCWYAKYEYRANL